MRHRILVLDPGHFHAPPGPVVEAFIALSDGFNNRNINPTRRRLESHIGVKALDS
ncbi:MAG: hypothetical protein VCE75_16410 [Alphaproteobacteria bacterium]